MGPDMKKKFVVLSLLTLAAVALTTADASAWGWWRYRSTCNSGPRFHWFGHGHHGCSAYNAFSPRPCCCPSYGCGHNPGHAQRPHHFGHRHAAPVGCAPAAGCCLASPVMSQDMQAVEHIDPSLIPYMAQAIPMEMPVQMQMPVQPVAYQMPYGMAPANFAPAYYQPYQMGYYPQQPAYPYYGYGR